jgi:hypothetical protein
MRALAGAALTNTATKTVLAVAMIASLAAITASAYAQEDKPALTRRSDAQKRDDEAIDKAYRAATKGEVEPVVKKDPWRTVRPADTDKAKR